MKHTTVCQSCGIHFFLEFQKHGKNLDGSMNKKFCRTCFGDGQFYIQSLNLDQMKKLSAQRFRKYKTSEEMIEVPIRHIHELERWIAAVSTQNR